MAIQDPDLVLIHRARLLASAARLQRAADRKATKPARRNGSARLAFERSQAWRELSARQRTLRPVCAECGSTKQLQADHIKPKSTHPHLALDPANLQTLCWPCNRRKAAT